MSETRRRTLRRALLSALRILALLAAGLFLLQGRMIYFPREYAEYELERIPAGAEALSYSVGGKPQRSFFLPAPGGNAEVLWVCFAGNSGLGLDWKPIAAACRKMPGGGNAAFLLVDYPGYGGNPGKPSRGSILEASRGAFAEAKRRAPGVRAVRLLGHSLGCASALQFAASEPELPIDRIVLVAPFTSMRAMAWRRVGPLCAVLTHLWDNRKRIAELKGRPNGPAIHIFHGDADAAIPHGMAATLARDYGTSATLSIVPGGDHELILERQKREIAESMMAPRRVP